MQPNTISISALAPILIIGLIFVAYCWYDIMRSPSVRYLPKWGWLIISALSIPVGGIIYLLFGRSKDA